MLTMERLKFLKMTVCQLLVAPLPLVAVICIYVIDSGCRAETKITVTAPVNPVDEGSILSIHCQIWNLRPDQEVGIYRNRSEQTRIERLSLDTVVHTEDNNNVFLAERQMMDGSVVFFLSIMGASRRDEGEYLCIISTVAGVKGVSVSDSVNIDFTYFPPDSDPMCTPNEQLSVNDGVDVQFDCSSAMGNPTVNFEWKRADGPSSILKHDVKIREISGRVHSTLTLTPSEETSGAVFICTIRSSAFPSIERTCHVGPLTVLRNGTPYPVVNRNIQEMIVTNKPTTRPVRFDVTGKDTKKTTGLSCEEQCPISVPGSPVHFWIISTIAAAVLTLIFLVLGVIIMVKYYRLTSLPKVEYMSALPPHSEEIYVEVDNKRREHCMYMSLEKSKKPVLQPLNMAS